MAQSRFMKMFRSHGALLGGHFELASGLHSDTYLQCALILQHPQAAARASRALLKPWRDKEVDVVVGPAVGGIIAAYELARQLGARTLYTERVPPGGMTLRRGFSIAKGEKVLVVEDVMTTGGSAGEVVDVVRAAGGEVVGVACFVDRGGLSRFGDSCLTASLLKFEPPVYRPEECPLCKQGIPIERPGQKGTQPARPTMS